MAGYSASYLWGPGRTGQAGTDQAAASRVKHISFLPQLSINERPHRASAQTTHFFRNQNRLSYQRCACRESGHRSISMVRRMIGSGGLPRPDRCRSGPTAVQATEYRKVLQRYRVCRGHHLSLVSCDRTPTEGQPPGPAPPEPRTRNVRPNPVSLCVPENGK